MRRFCGLLAGIAGAPMLCAMATRVRIFVAVLLACAGFSTGSAAEVAPPPPTTQEQDKPPRAAILDALFAKLSKADNEQDGKATEAAIQNVWLQSGSPSIDILMGRGLEAFGAKDYDRALFFFNEVVLLDPGFAEGWNKRAAVLYIKERYSAALKDLEQVLRLEPRHFLAMGGLALMLEELGDKKGALEVFRRALEIDPWLDGASRTEKALSVDVEGRGI